MQSALERPDDDGPRRRAFAARDASADGSFVAAIRSTGIYCRPSCPAKRGKPENVVLYDTSAAAEAAGYRACKRCHPDAIAPEAAAIAAACRLIERSDAPPDLGALARQAGFSASHFHRLFRRLTGVTPRAYAAATRAGRASDQLRTESTVTRAAFAAGYNATSRFYAEAGDRLGMSPSRYRAHGRGARIRFAIGQCSLGAILVAATDKGLCAISLGDDPDTLARELQDRFGAAEFVGDDPAFGATVAAVVALAEAPERAQHDLPLDIRGTAFQERVWAILRTIPSGRTASYVEIAEALGMPSASRAVAGACGANALALVIPCHRVVRSDGALSGYRWGVERKRRLLAREGVARYAATAGATTPETDR